AEVARFEGHAETAWGVAFFPDGRRAVSAGVDRTVRVWKLPAPGAPGPGAALAPGELRRFTGHRSPVKAVALSPDGRLALSGSGFRSYGDYTVRVWDVTTGRPLRVLTGHQGYVQGVAFSPDGKRALSSGADHTMRLWDVNTGASLRTCRT